MSTRFAPATGSTPDDSTFRTSILLVDDRPANLIALTSILEPLGQNLVTAASGEEALRLVLQQDFAVILLDVLMPGMDGFETASLIKQREKSHHIPIIFLTAVSTQEQHVFRGYTLGAVDYIAKPFDPDILRSKVAVFVELYVRGKRLEAQAELLRIADQQRRERELAATRQLGERRYRELAESMPQVVWTAQDDGSLRYCNGRWYELTGLDAEETRERGWPAVLHPDDLQLFETRWSDALREAQPFEAECRLRRVSDGSYRWHLLRAVPAREHGPEGLTWIGTSTDIDDRKRAEDGLRLLAQASTVLAELDVRSGLRQLADLTVAGQVDWCMVDLLEEGQVRRLAIAHEDPQRVERVVAFNHDHPPQLGPERGPLHVMVSGEPELVTEVTDEVIDAACTGPEQVAFVREIGLVSFAVAPLVARGRTHGALTLATAESGRVMDERDLRLAVELARRAALAIDNAQLYELAQRERHALEMTNRAKDEFLAILSHELRTPLNAIVGWTSLLRGARLDEATTRRAIDTIERNAITQSKLISDLLDVSRIISGKLRLAPRGTRLAPLVAETAESLSREAEVKGVTLAVDVEELPPTAADPERLQQVIANLIGNAIKFTPQGGRVDVRLQRDGDRAVIAVRDTGIGIDPLFLPHVFDRFRQGDSSSTRSHGGLGLGLSIVRHLTQLHGGHVTATSDGPGAGAEFRIELPLQPAGIGTAIGGPEVGSDEKALVGVRILLVEDQRDTRELFEQVLSEQGALVTAVASAAEGFEHVRRERPRVLLSDVGLPNEDGYTLIRRIRALPPEAGGQTPAAALTAFAHPTDGVDALTAGFNQHVPKPVPPDVLVAVVRRLLAEVPENQGDALVG